MRLGLAAAEDGKRLQHAHSLDDGSLIVRGLVRGDAWRQRATGADEDAVHARWASPAIQLLLDEFLHFHQLLHRIHHPPTSALLVDQLSNCRLILGTNEGRCRLFYNALCKGGA